MIRRLIEFTEALSTALRAFLCGLIGHRWTEWALTNPGARIFKVQRRSCKRCGCGEARVQGPVLPVVTP